MQNLVKMDDINYSVCPNYRHNTCNGNGMAREIC